MSRAKAGPRGPAHRATGSAEKAVILPREKPEEKGAFWDGTYGEDPNGP